MCTVLDTQFLKPNMVSIVWGSEPVFEPTEAFFFPLEQYQHLPWPISPPPLHPFTSVTPWPGVPLLLWQLHFYSLAWIFWHSWLETRIVSYTWLLVYLQRPLGLLSLLDEESTFPNGTDLTLANKLKQHLNSNSCFKGERDQAFTVHHYAGQVLILSCSKGMTVWEMLATSNIILVHTCQHTL